MNLKTYAREVFREVNKSNSKNKFDIFLKEFNKLVNEFKLLDYKNDVGCPISINCSIKGCYRYSICDFDNKKME